MRRKNTPPDGKSRLRELSHDVRERIKELNCLYGISRLTEKEDASLDDILRGVIDLIPPAWQYPEITCARIKLRSRQFQAANCHETPWKQGEPIRVNGKQFGMLEIYYLEARPKTDEGPFLKEERNLIHEIAERLGHTIERKLAQTRLHSLYRRERLLRERLEAETTKRNEFTRKLIHELKTPLTSLMATSQLLTEETHGSKLEKLANHVWKSAGNLNNRIEDLHDVTRGEIGTLKLQLKRTNIAQVLRSVIEETEALAARDGMEINLELNGPIPAVNADADRIRQVLLNLINNAIKYAREGKRVMVSATKKHDMVEIGVHDFGHGITRDQQRNLFEPAYRVSNNQQDSGGLGIGLALCRMLVELHGGKLRLRSKPGKGASFYFTVRTATGTNQRPRGQRKS